MVRVVYCSNGLVVVSCSNCFVVVVVYCSSGLMEVVGVIVWAHTQRVEAGVIVWAHSELVEAAAEDASWVILFD